MIQEPIAETFYTKLQHRMTRLRVCNRLDKAIDMGALIDPAQYQRITRMVQDHGGDLFTPDTHIPKCGCFYPPTLITGLSYASRLMQDEIFGPVLCAMTFRTRNDAVQLANNTRYGLEREHQHRARYRPQNPSGGNLDQWANMFDAAAGFGGLRDSSFSREGEWEGLLPYLKCDIPRVKSRRPLHKSSAPSAASNSTPIAAMRYLFTRPIKR